MKPIASRLPERLRDHNLTLVAAGVAFYAFLAFVPTLIAFISIYGLVADPADVKRQVHEIAAALPAEVQKFLVFQLTSIINAHTSNRLWCPRYGLMPTLSVRPAGCERASARGWIAGSLRDTPARA